MFLQDSTDVFEERKKRAQLEAERVKVKTGPPPFSAAMGQATAALAALSSQGVWGNGWMRVSVLPCCVCPLQVLSLVEGEWVLEGEWGLEEEWGWEGGWGVC